MRISALYYKTLLMFTNRLANMFIDEVNEQCDFGYYI
jgi:hypothetical protein